MYYCIIYIIAAIIMASNKEDMDADVDVDVGLDVGLDVELDVESGVNLYMDSSTLGIFLTPKQRYTQCYTSKSCRQRRMGRCCCSFVGGAECIATRYMCTKAGFRCL